MVADIGFGSNTEGLGDAPDSVTSVLVIVAALSIRQRNIFFGPLIESMFRRMKSRRMKSMKLGGYPGWS